MLRSTWGSINACKESPDPMPLADALHSLVEQSKTEKGRKYSWGIIEHQNQVQHNLATAYGIRYWDIFNATMMRPGGRRDCAHFCLPGPLDEMTRELLAYLTLPAVVSAASASQAATV